MKVSRVNTKKTQRSHIQHVTCAALHTPTTYRLPAARILYILIYELNCMRTSSKKTQQINNKTYSVYQHYPLLCTH